MMNLLDFAADKHWSIWEGSTSKLIPEGDFIDALVMPNLLSLLLVLNATTKEYSHHSNPRSYDVACPVENAWELKKKMPHMDLQIMDQSSHSTFELQIEQALLATMDKLKSAQSHINAIIQALYNGQDELKKDNIAIEQEKAHLWETMQILEQYAYVGKEIDKALEAKIAEIELQNAEKARVVKQDMLFYVRQQVHDLLTQLAVSIQGYMALDMIKKNNLELIKGVDRATTTTISALRTAVIVAQALTNQKLVLDQINALNTTTSNMIAGTASMLKQQAAQIGEQAASSTVEIDKLKAAFADIYETMDMMADYKVKALDNMQQTVTTLSNEIDKSKTYVDKIRESEAKAVAQDSNEVVI